MAAIAVPADTHLAMTTPAIEQPERLPTLEHTSPTLHWTRRRDACIKERRNSPYASTAAKALGGPSNRSRAFAPKAIGFAA